MSLYGTGILFEESNPTRSRPRDLIGSNIGLCKRTNTRNPTPPTHKRGQGGSSHESPEGAEKGTLYSEGGRRRDRSLYGMGILFEEPNPTGSRPSDLIGLEIEERKVRERWVLLKIPGC